MHVVETTTQTAAVCLDGTDLTYHGLTRTSGGRIVLPAQMIGRDVVEATVGSTAYRVSDNGLSVTENGQLTGSGWTDKTAYRNDSDLEHPGDLGFDEPIDYPECNGDIVVVTDSFRGEEEAKMDLPKVLAENPEWRYLRSDLTCDNFYSPSNDISDGKYIYDTFYTVKFTPENLRRLCDLERTKGYVVERLQDDVLSTEHFCKN